jgi:transcriptional regulator with XRE-family HTH domain
MDNNDVMAPAAMEDQTPEPSPGAIIQQARRQKGLSKRQLAERVGTTQQTIDKIEKGAIVNSKFLSAIKVELGLVLEIFAGQLTIPPSPIPLPLVTSLQDLPLYATAGRIGGNIWRIGPQPVAHVLRPTVLANAEKAYAYTMHDDSMFPQFRAGDHLWVDPSLPPLRGYSHVFSGKDGMVIGVLEAIKKDHYDVKVWNQDQKDNNLLCLPLHEWPLVHRIVGCQYK